MKKNLLMVMLGLVMLAPVSAETIVQSGSMMEGLPILLPKKESLQLHQTYSRSSKILHVNVKLKQKIHIDTSNIVTKKYGVLTATRPVILDCGFVQAKNKLNDLEVTIKKMRQLII